MKNNDSLPEPSLYNKNPFRKGSKRHAIAELMQQGKSFTEIQKELKMKNRTEIHKVRSELRRHAIIVLSSPAGATDVGKTKRWNNLWDLLRVKNCPVIPVTKEILRQYKRACAEYGYEGSLSDFVNYTVVNFFRSRGLKVKFVYDEGELKPKVVHDEDE